MTGRRQLAFWAILACIPFLVLALVEGIASFALFARTIHQGRIAEESHTERDTLLGWINRPSFSGPNIYGPGIGLHTNAQRFRHEGDVAPTPPAGRVRVVCSGDSFTLGYGVSDAQTWCARLAAATPALETINMGQGGYGLDQAYLWYMRDGLPLHANVHLFAFITPDFIRMRDTKFLGFPKPQLKRTKTGVAVTGVPVPPPGRAPTSVRWTAALHTLKTYELLHLRSPVTPRRVPGSTRDSVTWEVARAALGDLARRDSAAGTTLVVVYLPMIDDFYSHLSANYRRWVHAAAERKEFQLVDLVDALRHVPADTMSSLFLKESDVALKAAAGHFSVAGNAWVAEQLRLQVPALGGTSPVTPRAP